MDGIVIHRVNRHLFSVLKDGLGHNWTGSNHVSIGEYETQGLVHNKASGIAASGELCVECPGLGLGVYKKEKGSVSE